MLKACWDCIAGQLTHDEEAYGTALNGVTHQVPPWPQPQNERENMFLLPKPLGLDDNITLTGKSSIDPKTISISLITGNDPSDHKNVACQMDVNFPSNNGDNKIALKIIKDGYEEVINESYLATNSFVLSDNRDLDLSIRFKVRDGSLDIYIGPSLLDYVQLKHNSDDIRFIKVSGDVKKIETLNFEFS